MDAADQHLCNALRYFLLGNGGSGYLPILDRLIKSSQPEQLTFPPIDLGMIPGTGANHPFEAFEYTERS